MASLRLRIISLLCATLALIGLLPGLALACECGGNAPIQERLGSLGAVFAGTIATSSKTNVIYQQMTFEVSEVWKGPAQKYISVGSFTIGASCGWTAKSGVEYVIYAYPEQDGSLATSMCSGNEPLSQSEIRVELGNGTVPTASAIPQEVSEIPKSTEVKISPPVSNPPDNSPKAVEKKVVSPARKTSPLPSEDSDLTHQAAPEVIEARSFFSQMFLSIRAFISSWLRN